jgi:hypothetical protein
VKDGAKVWKSVKSEMRKIQVKADVFLRGEAFTRASSSGDLGPEGNLDLSHAALVAPKPDVEAVGEAEAEVPASFGEPRRIAVQFLAGSAFRHQDDLLPLDLVGGA